MKTARQYLPTHEQYVLMRKDLDAYVEISFREISIDEDGNVWSATGTEDFTSSRWHKFIERRYIYTPTGGRNNGGHREWEVNQVVICRSAAECRTMANHLMAGAEFQLRKY